MKTTSTNKEPGPRKKKVLIVLFSILGVLIILRLLLPGILLGIVNKKLNTLPGYAGHVSDIKLDFYRGAYAVQGIDLLKVDSAKNDTTPFFKCESIDLALDWSMLFKRALVGRIVVDRPVLTFVITEPVSKEKVQKVQKDTTKFQDLLESFMPVRLNRFEIHDGAVHYADLKKSPVIDLVIKNIEVTATNLTNVEDEKELLPARLHVNAFIYEGNFNMDVRFNLLEKKPTFDMKMELKKMNMVLLNDFFRAYGNFDVQNGTFSLYSEVAAKNGEFGGYIKPFIEGFKVKKYNDKEDFKQIAWETVIGTTMKILKNKETKEVATKVPISGKFDQPDINFWQAISYVLRNAFVNALQPSIDNSINVNKLSDEKGKTLLEKVFGDKKKMKKR